jgi:hypothetical protein
MAKLKQDENEIQLTDEGIKETIEQNQLDPNIDVIFPGGPTKYEYSKFVEIHGKDSINITMSPIDGKPFLWKILNRKEWRNFKARHQNTDPELFNDYLFTEIVMWPHMSLEDIEKTPAGLVDGIIAQFEQAAGFNIAAIAPLVYNDQV